MVVRRTSKEIGSAQSSLPPGYFYFFSNCVRRKFNFRYKNEMELIINQSDAEAGCDPYFLFVLDVC